MSSEENRPPTHGANDANDAIDAIDAPAQTTILGETTVHAASTTASNEEVKDGSLAKAAQSTSIPAWIERQDDDFLYFKGVRYVKPYAATMTVYAKRRWVGKPLAEVFEAEYSEEASYFREAISRGMITIDGKQVKADHVFRDNQFVEHRMHRHEKQSLDLPITILYDGPDFIVINKPPSLAVHPCGRYRKNTLLYLLEKEHGFNKLYCINRLDKLTSGLLSFAKDPRTAEAMHRKLRARTVFKQYYARVKGKFPGDGEELVCEKKLAPVSRKDAIYSCTSDADPDGLESQTAFQFVRYFPEQDQSIVLCKPLTGRTHQIRLHLQWMGHPIVNDPDYGFYLTADQRERGIEDGPAAKKMKSTPRDMGITTEMRAYLNTLRVESCPECAKPLRLNHPHDLFICLHAWKYELDGRMFVAPPPSWVDDPDIFSFLMTTRTSVDVSSIVAGPPPSIGFHYECEGE